MILINKSARERICIKADIHVHGYAWTQTTRGTCPAFQTFFAGVKPNRITPVLLNKAKKENDNILLEGRNRFSGANLTLSSDVNQNTWMVGLHERPLTYTYIIS